ncbi:lycopene cyclase domain-containing protein [Tepidiforma thermophila]|uniref:Lycopene cyclase domain-containing protein n=1 Tax=Tepidiforma thermophila (strain KCTC 52669 / CGMCC 1.13589 / G233) TaxID=2761530 RepID=A0A2A9HJ95_TEPT2|nr:lycopene cyclase domain-containing protein [Tepidiforma thermophila]PFG75076.1 lycopene cyclase domain-containing protein [Tepidiforma thermophila]
MTYGAFLGLFLLPPIAVLLAAHLRRPATVPRRELAGGIALLAVVAVAYTTPWDNYLVASGAWTYPEERTWGIRLGWVPLEEYCFFVLQTVMTGLWVGLLLRRPGPAGSNPAGSGAGLRWTGAGALLAVALGGGVALAGPESLQYLGLILAWAAPPLALQAGFGAEILARRWRVVLPGFGVPTLYLAAADTIAIRDGIWHITEATSTEIFLPGGLPVEEFVFFLVTNMLVTWGLTLLLVSEGRGRARAMLAGMRGGSPEARGA